MAREKQDREDLLAEATALVQRVSLVLSSRDEPLVIGFRRDDGASFYFTTERVFQFTSAGELRRAFVDGLLIKAEHGKLIALRKERTGDSVDLVRHELNPAETISLFVDMQQDFAALGNALTQGHFDVAGQIPNGTDVIGRIRSWLAAQSGSPTIARSPRVG